MEAVDGTTGEVFEVIRRALQTSGQEEYCVYAL